MATPASILVPVTVVTGPEALLADRAVADVVAAARAADADSEVRELPAASLRAGELATLTSPSLFGGRPVVVVRDVQDAPAEAVADLKTYLAAPPEDALLVLVHAGGPKARSVLDAARAGGARQVDCARVTRPGDLLAFVRGEVRAAGRSMTEDAARALLDAVGKDLRELASACRQLVADTADTAGAVDEQAVRTYYAGRAEVTSFNVADAAVEGRAAQALEQLRWALSVGVPAVLVTSALAQALRGIAKVASAQARGSRPANLARELEMPPWKVDRLRQQSRGWSSEGVVAALRAVAGADADIKGAADDPAFALERAVVAVARSRAGH